MDAIKARLEQLRRSGNFRQFPSANADCMIDLSSNDYLGLASSSQFAAEFWGDPSHRSLAMTSSASRLLATDQGEYLALEDKLESLYHRPALLFNSGYHANTGIVSSIADKNTVIIADKLVHASIIDGIKLSGAKFERFRHNDMTHFARLLNANADARRLLIVVESVYSMDGDQAPLEQIVDLKRQYPNALLMVDEAHAFGVVGDRGLGLAQSYGSDIDIIVGTFGKALASMGAFCVSTPEIKDYLINTARSLIFSTALPPITSAWTSFMIDKMLAADERRGHLRQLARRLHTILMECGKDTPVSHIQPYIVGDAKRAVALANDLRCHGIIALPIRVPTVPPGTERIRFSLSAALSFDDIDRLALLLQPS